MTKEELKKEAEEYALNQWEGNLPWSVIQKAYYDGALPREKQIQIDAEQIRALQKQNGELTDELKTLRESIKDYGAGCYENGLRNGKRKLEEQLTKAKELLKRYVPYRQITDSKAYKDLAEETEQFLSEVDK